MLQISDKVMPVKTFKICSRRRNNDTKVRLTLPYNGNEFQQITISSTSRYFWKMGSCSLLLLFNYLTAFSFSKQNPTESDVFMVIVKLFYRGFKVATLFPITLIKQR